ncbi:MAG: regulatory protein RecX [Anaerolineae bacterium]|nr:MAG: regulatory protein RecX [Anaerolineae bacterium]
MNRKITALRLQKRNPNRVNVYLDGEFAFGLSRIVAAWLQVGQELSAEKIAELQAQDAIEVAYQRALRFLEYRPRTRAEVQRNLQKHETPPEVIEEVLQRLERSGLLNDTAFAQAWIENRSAFRPRGIHALRQELRQRGVPEEVITEALQHVQPQEAELAYQAGLKRVRRFASLPWPDFRRKMGSYLARRGFPYPVIAEALQRLWEESHPNHDNDAYEEIP